MSATNIETKTKTEVEKDENKDEIMSILEIKNKYGLSFPFKVRRVIEDGPGFPPGEYVVEGYSVVRFADGYSTIVKNQTVTAWHNGRVRKIYMSAELKKYKAVK